MQLGQRVAIFPKDIPYLNKRIRQNCFAQSKLQRFHFVIFFKEKVSIHQIDNAERIPLLVASSTNNTAIIRRLLEAYDQEDARRFGRLEEINVNVDEASQLLIFLA